MSSVDSMGDGMTRNPMYECPDEDMPVTERIPLISPWLISPWHFANTDLFSPILHRIMEHYKRERMELHSLPQAAYPDVQELRLYAKDELLTIRSVTRLELYVADFYGQVEARVLSEFNKLMQERQYLTPLSVHDVLKKMAQEVVSDADH